MVDFKTVVDGKPYELTVYVDDKHTIVNVTQGLRTWHFNPDLLPAGISDAPEPLPRKFHEMDVLSFQDICDKHNELVKAGVERHADREWCYRIDGGIIHETISYGDGRQFGERIVQKSNSRVQSFAPAIRALHNVRYEPGFPNDLAEKVTNSYRALCMPLTPDLRLRN